MNQVLLTAGVAAIFIAVVGGGAKALGFEVPVLESGARQLALGIVGVVFLVGAVALPNTRNNGAGSDPSVEDYRQEVLATCRTLPRLPEPGSGTSFDRESYLRSLRAQVETWDQSLSDLWGQDVPDSLQDDKAKAEVATVRLIDNWGDAQDRLEQRLPAEVDFFTASSAWDAESSSIEAQASVWEAAMRRLAAAPCLP